MSLGSLLNIARTALVTHQRAINVTSHNVANANTPGYSRQRLALSAEVPLWTPEGMVGRGVTDAGVFAARDSFFEASFHRESGTQGRASMMSDLLGRIEAAFGEPSDTGLAATLDGFFNAWSDLASDPSSTAARTLVQQAGQQLAGQFRQIDGQLLQSNAEIGERLRAQVSEVNSIAAQIADLNQRIVAGGGPQRSAPDLEDQRNVLIDRLSGMMAVRVLPRSDGSIGVVAGETLLVDGGASQTLELRTPVGGGFQLALVGAAGTIRPGGGSISGLLDVGNVTLPGIQADLDKLAAAVVAQVNAVHQTGMTPGGVTATDFFDPAGLTARTIGLTAAVAASPAAIAAGATANAGDGAIALQLAGLRTTTIAVLGGNVGEFYDGLVAKLGSFTRDATEQARASAILVSNADARRASVSGVSIDEEMVTLIAQQQAYTAATRLVRVADEMLDDLLRMV